MNKVASFFLDEGRRFVQATLYFFVCFGVITLLMSLFMADYDLDLLGTGRVIIGALVVGKVVLVLENTSLGERFRHHALLLAVLWRSFIYTLITAAVLCLEKWVHGWREAGDAAEGLTLALERVVPGRAAAILLCLFGAYLGFNLMNEISRAMGPERLKRLLTDPEGRELLSGDDVGGDA